MPNTPRRIFRFSRLTDFSHSAMDWLGSISSLIVHTIFFAGSFASILFGFDADKVLLVVTTLVSLEAIYMAIFIQMAINRNTESLSEVEEDIEEIQKDVDEIQEDVDEIQKDVDEIQEDVDEIQKDVDEIQEDVEEIQEDVEEISEDEDDTSGSGKPTAAQLSLSEHELLGRIESQLQTLVNEIENLKKSSKKN